MRCSMSASFKIWLLHLDNGISCGGSARASAQHGRSVQDVSFASGRWHGSPLGMPPFAFIPRGAGKRLDVARQTRRGAERWPAEGAERWHWVDATCRSGRDEMRSDGLCKGRRGGTGYAARDMARQVKWADPALRREREGAKERERERENTREWETRAQERRERERARKREREREERTLARGSEGSE